MIADNPLHLFSMLHGNVPDARSAGAFSRL
jgi:hypothetical protein